MPEYVLTPDNKTLPSVHALLEELHRRGYPVEVTVKGSAEEWESIRFTENGPPLAECTLSKEASSGRLSVSTSADAPPEALDLQAHLVGHLLDELGGIADNTYTRERFSREEFRQKLRHHHGHREMKDLLWLAFAWIVVGLAVFLYFSVPPHLQAVDAVVILISLLSAAGSTWAHFKA